MSHFRSVRTALSNSGQPWHIDISLVVVISIFFKFQDGVSGYLKTKDEYRPLFGTEKSWF